MIKPVGFLFDHDFQGVTRPPLTYAAGAHVRQGDRLLTFIFNITDTR